MAAPDQGAGPVGAAEADVLLGGLTEARGVALAVSGGADSVALMRLVAAWRQRRAPALPLVVLTVDHGLRPDAADEARAVAGWAACAGLPHETLRWTGPKPAGNLQAAAREARYRLLLEACRRHGADHLLTAHHLDDQAETFLLRLARGSGVDGLAGMAPRTQRGDVVHLRPLLDVGKARLRATLRELGQDWIEDPSNGSARFARARLRALMPLLAEEGLDARRLAETAARMGRARQALEAAARALEAEAVDASPAGCAVLGIERLAAADEEVALRVLSRMLMSVGGGGFPPRLERLERLWQDLKAPGFRGATLAGCELHPHPLGCLACREWGRDGLPRATLAPGASLLWDSRFRVRNGGRSEVEVGALGGAALPVRPPLPRPAMRTIPAAFVGGTPVAAPLAGWPGPASEGRSIDFRFVELDQRPVFSDW